MTRGEGCVFVVVCYDGIESAVGDGPRMTMAVRNTGTVRATLRTGPRDSNIFFSYTNCTARATISR